MVNFNSLIKNSENNNVQYFYTILFEFKQKKYFRDFDNIYSLSHILHEVLLECNGNSLKNKVNNDLLNIKVDFFIKWDYLILLNMDKELNYLKCEINCRNVDIVKSIVNQILSKVNTKKYFNNLVDKLIYYCRNNVDSYFEQINDLLQSIIGELLYIGYQFDDVLKMLESVFENSIIQEDIDFPFPSTNFPYKYIGKKLTKEEMNEYINSLTFIERVKFIKKFYSSIKHYFYYIAVIDGISLNGKIIKSNDDITLFNPFETDIFPDLKNIPTFSYILNDNHFTKSVCVSVRVQAISNQTVSILAKEKLENYVNILKLILPRDNFAINTNNTVVLDKDKKFAFASHSRYDTNFDKRRYERGFVVIKEREMLDYTSELNDKIFYLVSDSTGFTETKRIVLNSVKKYSEALESQNDQEAILKYWSALESLFDNNLKLNANYNVSKFDLIKLILPLNYVISKKYLSLNNLYRTLLVATKADSSDIEHRNNSSFVDISDELLRRVGIITTQDIVSLKDLVLNIDPLIDSSNKNKYLYNKVCFVKKLFFENNFSSSVFNRDIKLYENHLTFIYRLRNQIIHNANSNNITTSYYLLILKKMIFNFLNVILDELSRDETLDINSILIKIYTSNKIALNKLNKNNLFAITFENDN